MARASLTEQPVLAHSELLELGAGTICGMQRSGNVSATAQALLVAAERLVAERGFSRTTSRQLTKAAGANVAAINYHFGSQRALFEALVERMVAPLRRERDRRLDALLESAEEVSVERVVTALIDSFASSAGERSVLLLGHILAEQDVGLWNRIMTFLRPVDERYVDALQARLPAMERDDLTWRYQCLLSVIVFNGLIDTIEGGEARLTGRAASAELRQRFVAFALGAFDRPSGPLFFSY